MTTATATPVVLAESLVRRFGNGRGVGPVSLEVGAAETVALMGPNGCGKTTLLRMIATVSRPQQGTVHWFGGDATAARGHLGLALDGALEDGGLSGRQATAFWCAQWVHDRDEVVTRSDRILDRLDLGGAADDAVASYSFGMRRRLALAAALVHDPRLALLDEPTAGLDPDGVGRLTAVLRSRHERGLTTLVASNDAVFVAAVADRVAFLDDGLLVRCATPAQLLAELPGGRLAEMDIDGGCNGVALRAVDGVVDVVVDRSRVTVRFEDDRAVAALVAAADAPGGRLRGLRLRRPDLTDCFRSITGRPLEEEP